MKLATFFAAVVVLVVPGYADVQSDEPPGITVVGSSQQELPDVQHVSRALDLAQVVLGRRRLPHLHLVLMYVDAETGRIQGISKKTDVVVVHFDSGTPDKYYVWIVGGANDERLSLAVVAVLVRQWELKFDKKQMDAAAHRVRLGLSGVVSARDLAREGESKVAR